MSVELAVLVARPLVRYPFAKQRPQNEVIGEMGLNGQMDWKGNFSSCTCGDKLYRADGGRRHAWQLVVFLHTH